MRQQTQGPASSTLHADGYILGCGGHWCHLVAFSDAKEGEGRECASEARERDLLVPLRLVDVSPEYDASSHDGNLEQHVESRPWGLGYAI